MQSDLVSHEVSPTHTRTSVLMWDQDSPVPPPEWFVVKPTPLINDPETNTLSLGMGLFTSEEASLSKLQRILPFVGDIQSAHYHVPPRTCREDFEYCISMSRVCTANCTKRECMVLQCRDSVLSGACKASRSNTANNSYRLQSDGKSYKRLDSKANNAHAVLSSDGKEIWLVATKVFKKGAPTEILWPFAGNGYQFPAPVPPVRREPLPTEAISISFDHEVAPVPPALVLPYLNDFVLPVAAENSRRVRVKTDRWIDRC
jgi:hypothetical protein